MSGVQKNLVGQRFGRLIVVGGRTSDAKGNASWVCLCDCGNQKSVRMSGLLRGSTKSCGCLAKEHAARNGYASRTHGLSYHPLYQTWDNMIDRCENPLHKSYKDYGERGITVCEEWKSLPSFIDSIAPKPDGNYFLDRIDNNLGYSKDNCRWATIQESNRNTRANVLVSLDGMLMTIAEASEKTGINYTTIHYRHTNGRTQETGLFAPVST